MSRRLIGVFLVVVTACALVSVARNLPAEAARQQTAAALPVTPAAEVPVCPGPETLQAPDGAAAVPAPGPVALAGVAALTSALGQPSGSDAPAARRGRPAAAPVAGLSLIGARLQQAGTESPSSSTGPTPSGTPAGPPVRVVRAAPTQAGAWRLDVRHVGEVPVVAAAQWTLGVSGDLRGLAGTTCAPAATDTWLVGGGTQPGRRLRLLLANPGVSPTVVDVTLLGPRGVVQAPAGTGVTVAPGAQKALYLDALAPGLSALAVHVEARTGRVAATLHDSVVRGLVAGGTDDVPAAAPPARRQVIPGVSVAVAAGGGQSGQLPTSATAPGAVAVRVAAPGGADAVVRVHLFGPDGEVNLPGGGVATVPPRGVVDLPVTGVPDGTYAAVVDADSPVVAAALIGRAKPGSAAAGTPVAGSVPPAELAWSAGGRALQASTAIALPAASALAAGGIAGHPSTPPALTARIALAPLSGAAGQVVLAEVAADGTVGAARSVEVPAGRSVSVDVAAGSAGVLLRPDPRGGPVVAALVVTASDDGGGLISVQAVRPGSQNSGDAPTVVQDLRVGLAPTRSASR